MIRVERIQKDIQTIAGFTQSPGKGATRPTFSSQWGHARDYVAAEARAAACDVRIDPAGNLHARPKYLAWDRPAWLCGSHIDSVPHGGDYDGVVGVVCALEILRSAAEDSAFAPIELVVFAEEEGTTFGVGMLGSRAWVGDFTGEKLATLRNADGQNYLEAGKPFGVDEKSLPQNLINPQHYLGLIEVHIEQGPGMWRANQQLAVVRAIAGRRQLNAQITGEANHTGATSMTDRRDALAGAAEIILELERLAKSLGPHAVITVGRIENHPNAINVISDKVEFTIDLRAPDDNTIQESLDGLKSLLSEKPRARGLKFRVTETERIPACPLDSNLCDRLAKMASLPMTVSGALHDSAVVAPRTPTAMLFIPSKDGISHNPAEFSRVEDVAAAASVVEKFVRRPTIAQLNQMQMKDFLAICGGIFEHSPWIAEQAWKCKPFASISDLHEKMTSIVIASSDEEKLALIRAHPDLVGRLFQERKLTSSSGAEQAAAGLTQLSSDEIAAFSRLNAEYRDKFGFPFVICARLNRKDAILEAFPKRLANSRETELATALAEVFKIARLRLADAVWED
jgi:allantoate deiminase